MCKYINILSISIFLISVYILYTRCKISGFKKGVSLTIILTIIIAIKSISTLESSGLSSNLNLNFIYQIMIILFIMQMNLKNGKYKKTRLLIFINYTLCIFSLVLLITKGTTIYNRVISIYVLMTTVYLFSVILSKIKIKPKYTLVYIVYFGYMSTSIIIQGSINLMYLGCILDLVSSIYILVKLFKLYIEKIYIREDEVVSHINRSKITMKIHDEKLNINKSISETINKNLKKKQNILDLILDQSNKCVLLIDKDGYILNEDDGFSKMWREYSTCKYKISLNTFLRKSIKSSKDFIDKINEVNATNKDVYGEIEGKDGRFFECTYAPFNIENKKIGIICVIADVTYKKKSEIKIKENDAKYKKIVDNIPYSVLLTSDNDILYNNEKNPDVDFNSKDIKSIITEKSTSGELYYTCPNGLEVCLNIDRVEFLERGYSKSLVVIRDITEYKKLLRNIEYSKKKYEALVNIIPEGIYILNFETKLLNYANSTFLRMIGVNDIEDVKLNTLNENMIMTSGSTNDSVIFNRAIIKNNYGEDINIECGGMLIDVNKRLKMIGIVRDITDQVKAELMEIEIEEKENENKSKTEFFINMSHELKTPLNVIYSSNQLLESIYKHEMEKNPQSEISNTITIVKKHLNMSMVLIDNIMDLVKLESDFHDINRDYYNIVPIAEDIVTEFNQYVCSSNIQIVFDTDQEEKIANIDPDDIEKIILILLSMVVRYSSPDSTIYFDLGSNLNKNIISIKNIGGYDYSKYVNDQERKILDIGIDVAKLIINLYGGSIDIKISPKKEISILIQIQLDEKVKGYRKRTKARKNDFIHAEYTRMCSF